MNEPTAPTVSVSLTVKDAAAALDFYSRAFGAQELYRMAVPGGGVAHAEFMIGNTRMFISDESEEWSAMAMPAGTKASCLFAIAVDSCDAAHQQALEAGGESLSEPQDQFWGMRSSIVLDPFGYRWSLGQVIEELSNEELARRAQEIFGAN